MRNTLIKPVIYLLGVLYCSGALAKPLPYKLLKIEDGDTIVIEFKDAESRIQLSGIDAPENTRNAKLKLDIKRTGLDATTLRMMGRAATAYLQSLLPPGSTVMVDANMDEQDKYGRIPAIVSTPNGLQVNKALVENGYAVVLTRYPLDVEFKTHLQHKQIQAQKNHRGLWGQYPKAMKIWFDD